MKIDPNTQPFRGILERLSGITGDEEEFFLLRYKEANDWIIIDDCIQIPTQRVNSAPGSPFAVCATQNEFERAAAWINNGYSTASIHNHPADRKVVFQNTPFEFSWGDLGVFTALFGNFKWDAHFLLEQFPALYHRVPANSIHLGFAEKLSSRSTNVISFDNLTSNLHSELTMAKFVPGRPSVEGLSLK